MSDTQTLRLDSHIRNWRRIASDLVTDCRVFQVRRHIMVDPRDMQERDFFVIEATDWMNVIPLTAADEVVLVEQYRHGTDEITLEIPGGMVDAGESPADTAARELLEETGYSTTQIDLLSRTRPNPAIQNNWLHSFVAKDCSYSQPPQLDGAEDITVRLVPLEQIPGLIMNGTINHALVVAAFYAFFSNSQNRER